MAWVLIFGLGYTWAFTISNIASETACIDLGKRMQLEWTVFLAPNFKCYQYQAK